METYRYPTLPPQFNDMVTLVLRSDDELLHVTLYSWFISEDMPDKLVEVIYLVTSWHMKAESL